MLSNIINHTRQAIELPHINSFQSRFMVYILRAQLASLAVGSVLSQLSLVIRYISLFYYLTTVSHQTRTVRSHCACFAGTPCVCHTASSSVFGTRYVILCLLPYVQYLASIQYAVQIEVFNHLLLLVFFMEPWTTQNRLFQ